MPDVDVIGDISNTGREATVEWTIKKFSSLSDKANYCYESPPFVFCNSRWRSGIFPNGETSDELSIPIRHDETHPTSEGWVSLSLIPMDSGGSPVDVTFQYSLKKPKNVFSTLPSPTEMPKGSRGMSAQKLVLRSHLLTRKPATLVVSCRLTCAHPGGAFSKRLMYSSPNFQAIVDMKKYSDYTVKVENREFHCHRVILASKSGYFSRLFETDMEEQRRNEVEIGDMEASVFEFVLVYLYCGDDKMLSKQNVFDIYKASAKLLMKQLKETCAEYIKRNMGTDIVCDAITLAKMYEDEELEECALDYLTQHSNDVLQSPNWTEFKKEINREFVIEVLEETVKKMAGENSELRDKERERLMVNSTYASSTDNDDISDFG